MANRLTSKNLVLTALLLAGIAGTAWQGYQYWRAERVNQAMQAGKPVSDDGYVFQKKFSAAYQQGRQQDYKHALQTYNQLLETALTPREQAMVHLNIANNMMLLGLSRRFNEDGSLIDDARYDLTQAKGAFEQSLRLAPDNRLAKFNFSLLLSLLPKNMGNAEKEQSGVLLSNMPIGLP
ncbi:MAG: hypothetical protein ACAH10_00910 [Methylophilaceae bacterium]